MNMSTEARWCHQNPPLTGDWHRAWKDAVSPEPGGKFGPKTRDDHKLFPFLEGLGELFERNFQIKPHYSLPANSNIMESDPKASCGYLEAWDMGMQKPWHRVPLPFILKTNWTHNRKGSGRVEGWPGLSRGPEKSSISPTATREKNVMSSPALQPLLGGETCLQHPFSNPSPRHPCAHTLYLLWLQSPHIRLTSAHRGLSSAQPYIDPTR